MLVFNEGVPRAGKSYDAVKTHILPALQKRRRVFARLNGLDVEAIAKYLKMPVQEVGDLLELIDTKDVKERFTCYQDDTGKWCIPDEFKDSLVVIDEVHEFYVNQRQPLPENVENFWALLGQNGGDAVIMTQWINRVHQAIRARIERKNTFQKLTAVGMKGRYLVTYHHATSPGKYEVVGSKREKYDKAIYPLYHGYAPGSENTEVYDEGGTNVWLAMLPRALAALLAAAVGAWAFVGFFFGGSDDEAQAQQSVLATEGVHSFDLDGNYVQTETAAGVVNVAQAVTAPAPPDPFKGLTPEQRYVAELADKGRVRLAARAEVAGRVRGWVEWVDDSGNTLESLDVDAVQELGYQVSWSSFGVKLQAGDHVIIATAWPRVISVRDTEHRLYRLDGNGGGAGLASVASEPGAAAGAGVTVGYAPGQRADVFPRSPGYVSESYTGPTSTL